MKKPPKLFDADIDCRKIAAPSLPRRPQSAKVCRKEIDCRRLHEPIPLPDSSLRYILEVHQEIVPIIFVPGIMGSRLRDINGKKVWDPDAKIFMLCKFGLHWQSAKKRKDALVGNAFDSQYLSVIEHDTSHNKKFADRNDPTRAARGWGGVGWSSYGDFLIALQNKQWEPLVHLNFSMPVHAFGYNWTACNSLAAEKLTAYIDETIRFYKGKGRHCERVILVTHSMGGLVARAACKRTGVEQKVLGVIHGVQPATGSPAAYWRMKGGFERSHTIPELDNWQWLKNPAKTANHKMKTVLTKGYDFGMGTDVGMGNVTAWVLGADGEEVTSLLGNMPGGLELLPNKRYRDNDGNRHWLVFVNPDGKKTRLPKCDPYEEIYSRKEEFYRLVNPDWLNPSGDSTTDFETGGWDLYSIHLEQAKQFHKDLGNVVHPDTYHFYSTGVASADRVVFVRTLDTWGAKGKRLLDIVKNEWFDNARSTAADKAKEEILSPLTTPVKRAAKQTLFQGLSWKDVIFHPGNVIEIGRRLPEAMQQAPGVIYGALTAYPAAGTVASAAVKAVGKGLVVEAAMNVVGLFVRDTEWYINRGGYQDRVDKNGRPYPADNEPRDVAPPVSHPEAIYVITMKTPDGAGDGTVPESSARALDPSAAATTKFNKHGKKIKRTFAIGDAARVEADFAKKKAPRTSPKSPPDFGEGWFDRGHEPIYKSKSAQHITFTAVENICRRWIADQRRRK